MAGDPLSILAVLARPGRVAHVEMEPAVKPRGVSSAVPGAAEQVLPWLISGSGHAGRGQPWRPAGGSAGCAGGGAGGAERVPQAGEVNGAPCQRGHLVQERARRFEGGQDFAADLLRGTHRIH